METLESEWFKGDQLLEATLNRDQAHILPGARGDHVGKIQGALGYLLTNPPAGIADGELRDGVYGRTTAAAVLRYKSEHDIVNRAYQTQADNIVGKMTMRALDQAMKGVSPSDDKSQEVGTAIFLTLIRMDAAMGQYAPYLNRKVRIRLEVLRAMAALASRGKMSLSGNIQREYDRGAMRLAIAGSRAPPPIVFAAAPVAAAGAAVTALEIAIIALGVILLLCIVSEDFRKEVSRLASEAIQSAAESSLSAIQEAGVVRADVEKCNDKVPNPTPRCKERREEFKKKNQEFKDQQKETSRDISDAFIRFFQISEIERRALLQKVQAVVAKLEQALKALKDAKDALWKDCGCRFVMGF